MPSSQNDNMDVAFMFKCTLGENYSEKSGNFTLQCLLVTSPYGGKLHVWLVYCKCQQLSCLGMIYVVVMVNAVFISSELLSHA